MENGTETRFVYDGGRVIEERRGSDDSVLASYVHGAYIDDVVTMRRAVPQGGIPADWFFHSDDQFSVSAVTNAAGALAERVAYGDFGAPTFFTPGGSAMVASAIGNPYAFTGRRWDAAERTYHYRFRTFSPGLGRFTTRDPIGIWGDALNLGNGYTYTGNDPWSWVDPWGEDAMLAFPYGFDEPSTVCATPVMESATNSSSSVSTEYNIILMKRDDDAAPRGKGDNDFWGEGVDDFIVIMNELSGKVAPGSRIVINSHGSSKGLIKTPADKTFSVDGLFYGHEWDFEGVEFVFASCFTGQDIPEEKVRNIFKAVGSGKGNTIRLYDYEYDTLFGFNVGGKGARIYTDDSFSREDVNCSPSPENERKTKKKRQDEKKKEKDD